MTAPFADGAALIIPPGEDPPMNVVRAWIHGVLTGVALVPRLRVALVAEEFVSNAAGLVLVEGLSLDWGVEWHAEGKTAWAEVALGVWTSGLVVPAQPPPGALG